MSELSQPYILYGEPLERAVFQSRLVIESDPMIMQHSADPELIVRRNHLIKRKDVSSDEAMEIELTRHLDLYAKRAKAVQELDSQYGIRSPSYIVGLEDTTKITGDKSYTFYMATNRIHGIYFALENLRGIKSPTWQLDQIPEGITVAALEKILTYFEAIRDDKVHFYLRDLRLGNLMYGHLQGDDQNDIYAFDLESNEFMDAHERGYLEIMHTARGRSADLAAMQRAYGHGFSDIKIRIAKIADDLAEKHETWRKSRQNKK